MPFPGGPSTHAATPKKGKSRSRRYDLAWTYREDPSNDDAALHHTEVRSTNIGSAVTALLKILNEGVERDSDEFLRKSHIVVVEARVLARGESVADAEE